MDQIPEALKNNSSICITAASKASGTKSPNGTSTAPQGAPSPQSSAERPPRPPTVDLTAGIQEGASQPPPLVPTASFNKPQTCHTCNKHFSSYLQLNAHISKVHAGAAAQRIQFKLVLILIVLNLVLKNENHKLLEKYFQCNLSLSKIQVFFVCLY